MLGTAKPQHRAPQLGSSQPSMDFSRRQPESRTRRGALTPGTSRLPAQSDLHPSRAGRRYPSPRAPQAAVPASRPAGRPVLGSGPASAGSALPARRPVPRLPLRAPLPPGQGTRSSARGRAGLTFVLQVHQDQQEREHRAQPAAQRAGGHHVQGRRGRAAGRCAAQQPARRTARSPAPAVRPLTRSLGRASAAAGAQRRKWRGAGPEDATPPERRHRRRPIASLRVAGRPGSPGSWLAPIGCGRRRPAPSSIG